ncbi:magnesium transporter CorA family protein [Cytobacillus sp. S13-E01]|uniref:magnesium transporter CorA family protein n=1 Tax=Cytobacillus sp. S13-E01 TaxID=3031326 RepID=UPI0023D8225D|nr:magnesium transporter CorA family protein [Cytobacillus sp. S13-E01]MDF0727984.1 magnesium transporter CorA family protein [Cytobacillus sp. S13-E01]
MLCYKKGEDKVFEISTFKMPSKDEIIWFHIQDKNDKLVDESLQTANIHPLARKAMKSKGGIPRVDIYTEHAFVCTNVLQDDLSFAAINIVVGPNYVISTIMKDINIIKGIQEECRVHPDHMVTTGHILYHIFDSILSIYLSKVDEIADDIQDIEKRVFKTPFANEIGHEVHNTKYKLHEVRQIVEAQENVIKDISHADFPYIDEEAGFYVNELVQNFSRVTSAFDSFKNTLTSIFDLQMSLKSDHMNIIMKTLTLVSVIFIPMTFIAGLYGMNFERMPELKWDFGYFYALLLMFGIGISTLVYFKKKGWW